MPDWSNACWDVQTGKKEIVHSNLFPVSSIIGSYLVELPVEYQPSSSVSTIGASRCLTEQSISTEKVLDLREQRFGGEWKT